MASQLDGAGQMKMVTLDEALVHLQRVHAIVERYGIAVRNEQETGSFRMQIQRAATPLVGMLKSNFGQIADVVTALILASTRGGGDQAKLRALREYVAQVRTQLEIATTRVNEKHGLADGSNTSPRRGGPGVPEKGCGEVPHCGRICGRRDVFSRVVTRCGVDTPTPVAVLA